MFGIGSTELLVILAVALIVLGPKSLAGISRTLGKAMGEFRRVSTDFQRTLNAEVDQEEQEKRRKDTEKPAEPAAADSAADTIVAETSATERAQAAAARLKDAEDHTIRGEELHSYSEEAEMLQPEDMLDKARQAKVVEGSVVHAAQSGPTHVKPRAVSLTGPATPPAGSALAEALAASAKEAHASATAPDLTANDNATTLRAGAAEGGKA